MSKEKLMGAVKDMYYDVETLFIEGYGAKAIASQLCIPIEYVYDVLDDFGVARDDVAEKPHTEEGYYGA
jgi:hypothetical protein